MLRPRLGNERVALGASKWMSNTNNSGTWGEASGGVTADARQSRRCNML